MKRIAVLLCLLLAGCTQPQEAPLLVFVGATLIDGSGGPPLAHAVVVVQDGRIAAIGEQAHLPIPRDSRKIDAAGWWLQPLEAGKTIRTGEPASFAAYRADPLSDAQYAAKLAGRVEDGRWQPAAGGGQ
jgi:hypothetical protein